MVELFLAREDIQVNVQEAPPLFYAASEGHVEVVRRLLCVDTIDIDQQSWNSSPLCCLRDGPPGSYQVTP